MDHAKRMSAGDSFIEKVKMSVETESIHTYVYGFGRHFRLSVIIGIAYRLTSGEFAVVVCRRFAVGILMIYVIASKVRQMMAVHSSVVKFFLQCLM